MRTLPDVDLSDVQGWIAAFSYPAALALLVLAGFGAPLSEDLILLAAGIVTATEKGNLPLMIATAWVGVLLGDSALFGLGRRLGPRAANLRFLRKVLTPERIQRVNRHFARHGLATIFVVRFCIGLRAPAFVTAGMSRMHFRRFLAVDAAAALIYVPLLVWIGWRFGAAALDDVRATFTWILIAVVALGVALLVGRAVRHGRGMRFPRVEKSSPPRSPG